VLSVAAAVVPAAPSVVVVPESPPQAARRSAMTTPTIRYLFICSPSLLVTAVGIVLPGLRPPPRFARLEDEDTMANA
jgi:hypothetical protein